jgi:hypothetical protein
MPATRNPKFKSSPGEQGQGTPNPGGSNLRSWFARPLRPSHFGCGVTKIRAQKNHEISPTAALDFQGGVALQTMIR